MRTFKPPSFYLRNVLATADGVLIRIPLLVLRTAQSGNWAGIAEPPPGLNNMCSNPIVPPWIIILVWKFSPFDYYVIDMTASRCEKKYR